MKTQAAAEPSTATAVAYWTPAELAERLRVEIQTLRQWRWRGRGPTYIRAEGSIRYPIEDVLQWELSHRNAGGTS